MAGRPPARSVRGSGHLLTGDSGPPLWTVTRAMLSAPAANAAFGYFYALDLLRGLAALGILFWHYSHFFAVGPVIVPHDPADYPFYREFWLFYEHGGNAVQLFWLVSGFTLSTVYTRRPQSGRTFLVHRFARLYPLHLITLLAVVVLQWAAVRSLGEWLIYGNNDLPHFVDQLFLLSGWGPNIRFSFNGPIWTVSVELLIYGIFWALLPRLFGTGVVGPLLVALLGLWLSRFGPFQHIFQGIFYFFVGCGLYPVFLACREHGSARLLAVALPLLAAFAALVRWHAIGACSGLLLVGLVLAASFVDGERHGLVARRAMKWIGDNTYGVYLWHVPIQLSILLLAGLAGWSKALFLSPPFFLLFFALVLVVSRTSFLLVERPCRAWLKDRLAGGRGW